MKWVRAHPKWSFSLVAVLALVIGAGIGVAGSQAEIDDLESEVAGLEDQVKEANREAAEAKLEMSNRLESIEERERGLGEREEAQEARLAREEGRQRREARERRRELDEREEEVSSAEAARERSKIGDGIWQQGRDFEPGLYRAEGGDSCYWAKLNSASTDDIDENGGFSPNQTLQIDSAFFQTNDCGEWVKIG